MKKALYILTVFSVLFNCEDVIDLKVPNSPPKLVIEASINWQEGTIGNEQEIKLTQSAPYFDNQIPAANNAIINITDTANNTFNFVEEGNTGIYKNTTFIPVLNQEYTLNIIYQNEVYTATETLKPIVPIDYVEQENEGGFAGDETEIKAFYTDPEDQENYYFFEFYKQDDNTPYIDAYNDEFTNGNQIFAYYADVDLETGQELTIRNYGVSKQFYEFMILLMQQTSVDSGGPFQSQPATVHGNCINTTNPEKFPFGYFRLSEYTESIYTIQ